jgi:hypothetical protein
MENDEQTANESSQPQPKSSSMRLVVMGVVLTAMVVMALIQSGARSKRDAAADAAGELMESEDYTMPADYMKAVGKTARIVTGKETLAQVYRWNGVLQHFELRILFIGSDGDYMIEDIKSSAVSRFKADDISKLALAKKTGTEHEEFPELEEGLSEIDGDPDAAGVPGGNPGGGPGGGPGAGGSRGGGGGMSAERMKERMVASFEKLELDEAQQAKVDAIIEKQLTETMALLGGPREGMREKFGALREKYTAQFKEALTEEQFEAYEKSREDARKNRGGGRGGGGGGAPPRPGGPPEPGK